ncbi:MAG: serine/threonine protein kinase [Planctomycetota bacterium]
MGEIRNDGAQYLCHDGRAVTNFDQPFEDYELLDRVGAGAMGTVFKARHKRLNRIVALKILKPSLARDKRYVERLRREARIVASLSHAHIVTGHDLGEEGGYHYFVMEFVEGKSLRQLLTEWGMFSEDYVIRVARETAMALDHAYQRDVIHRDIKPGNILIDENGRVKLTDMGLAKGPADLTLTRDGATVGTPMYISPEQARNPQDVDVRSDLYSLGATLYHMATGVPPFSGDTMAQLITNVLNENVVPPDEANSAVSPGMSLVIRKLLAKNLTVRYQTPRELLDDLDLIEKSQPPAVDLGRLEAANDESSRWLRIVLVAMTAVLLTGGAWWLGKQMVDPVAAAPSAEDFLVKLDNELAALPNGGARYLHLRVADPPPGSVLPLERRRKQVAIELQQAVDDVVNSLDLTRPSRIYSWLIDPLRWPDLATFERERLYPMVRKQAGINLDQMPSAVRTLRVEQLQHAVATIIRQRDAELLVGFDHFLTTQLPGRANERLRVSHFAAADVLWRDALRTFCNGADRPFPERLAKQTRTTMETKRDEAKKDALAVLKLEEEKTIHALEQEVADTVAVFVARLKDPDPADPWVVSEALQRFRSNLGDTWPPADNFRLGSDPWKGVEQKLMSVEHAVVLAMSELQGRRFDARCDLAWRVYCNGDAVAARSVLDDMDPATEAQRQELAGHRSCLDATQLVEQAILRDIAEQSESSRLVAFRGGTAYVLRIKTFGETLRLFGETGGQRDIELRLTELRIGDLLGPTKLNAEETGPVQKLASGSRLLGLAVLRLAADDTDGLERHVTGLDNADRTLLLDYVWPRIDRARGVRSDQAIDRDTLFVDLEKALANLEQGGALIELTIALFAVASIPSDQCTPKQHRLLREARKSRDLYGRERSKRTELEGAAPRDALVDVRVRDGELDAAVTLPASVLHGDAGPGWEIVGKELEFAGGGGLWKEQANRALHGRPGHDARSKRSRLDLEMKFPAGDNRWYIIEFDGIKVMLVIAENDSVQVELIEGDALDEAAARKAFGKALLGVSAPAKAYAIPGSLQRLTIDVVAAKASTQANVVVKLENKVLLSRLFKCDQKQAPDFIVHAMKDLSVLRATVHVFGL